MSQNHKYKELKLAVLMTCYNRKYIALNCLEALSRQNTSFQVYLVDDGSSDGTSEAVKQHYPNVKILQGNGNLFWGGGMRMAFAEAMQHSYDYYLWLNDDTILESNALNHLMETYQLLSKRGYQDSIVVGSVKDPTTGKYTYGGRIRSKRRFSNTFEAVEPDEEPQECDTMQGNVVLIPNAVVEKVGNLDIAFTHQRGDLDYGLRARKLGCSIWVAPRYLGTCSQNNVSGSWVDTSLPIHKRLQKVFHVKGFPIREWTIYTKRHSGPFWFIYWTFPYIRAVIGYRNLSASPTFCEDGEQETSNSHF